MTESRAKIYSNFTVIKPAILKFCLKTCAFKFYFQIKMAESQDSTIRPLAKNPWLVESVHSFLFLKCPECVFDTEYENEATFEHHALENHPWSNVLFSDLINDSPITVENQILDSIKIENHDNFEDSDIANENSILPHMSENKDSSDNCFQPNEVLSEVKIELAEVEENSTKDQIEQNSYKKGENCDNNTMTAKLVVDIIEHFDIADPSEIQTSDNLMKFSDPLQMLKSGKNKRKAEKAPRTANKTRQQQLKASEAAQTCAQPKKKKVKREHKIANNTKENKNLQIGIKNPCPICNMSFYDRYWFD